MNFKIQAGFIGQSHDFPKDKSDGFDEERVDQRINDLSMSLPGMFIDNDVVLNEEVRNIIV